MRDLTEQRLLSEARDDSAIPDARLRVLQDKVGDGLRKARREAAAATEVSHNLCQDAEPEFRRRDERQGSRCGWPDAMH
jgi:hypothetical protein